MQVELHLLGTAQRWKLSAPRIRIGRDPACEVSMGADRYPMVSREHAILTVENGRIRLTDNQSTNGTFVNGTRISNAMLTKLDRFSLGKDGPEFEMQVIEDQPPTGTPTVVQAVGTKTKMDAVDPASTPTRIAKAVEQPNLVASGKTSVGKSEAQPPDKPKGSAPVSRIESTTGVRISREEEQMIEQKLSSLRNLVYLLVAMVAVLLGVIFYQSQQIDRNRSELSDMRRQAQNAVAQFTPALDQKLAALDQRLASFDQRMNQADGKMKDAQDAFLTRINSELPKMLDKYVDRKMRQFGEAVPKLPQPDEK